MLLRFTARTALCTGIVLPFMAMPASAQTASADTAQDEAAPAKDGNEIIVTATRRSERLQDVPISVTAVQGDKLTQRGVTNPEELTRVTPTLTSMSGAANTQGTNFSIRGVGTGSFQRTIESSVATVIDDVTLIRPEMGVLNFNDIDQVEVLNGPQGMLFGKNASAGVVSIRTKNPVLGETSGKVGGEFSQYNTQNHTQEYRLSGILNLPVSSTMAARFNVLLDHKTAMYKNLVANPRFEDGVRQITASGKLLWEPTDRLSILIAGDYMDSKGLGPGVASFRSVVPGSPNGLFLASVHITPGPDNTFSAYDLDTYADTKIGGGQIKIDYDLGGGTMLTNIAAFRTFHIATGFDADYSPAPLVQHYVEPRSFNQVSDELRIASPTGGAFDYQVGLYALLGSVTQRTYAEASLGSAPPPGFTTTLGGIGYQHQNLGSFALFGQGTYHLSDALRVIGGARLTYDTVEMRYFTTPNGAAVPLFTPAPLTDLKRHHTNVSWRGIAQYDLNHDVMLYGTVAKGYKGPGFSQFSSRYVAPEISTHFEAGIKTEFLDRHVTLNLSAYHTGFTDFQSQAVDFSTLTILVRNAGKLVTQGFDAQLTARPVEGLSLSGGLAYTDARFRKFLGDACYAGQAACVGGSSDSSGNRLPSAPKWKAVGDARYEWAFNDALKGHVQIGVTAQTSVEYYSNANPAGHQPGFTTVDLALGLAGKEDSWQLNLFCRNCADKRYVAFVGSHPLVTADYLQNYSYSAFRSIGASLDFNF